MISCLTIPWWEMLRFRKNGTLRRRSPGRRGPHRGRPIFPARPTGLGRAIERWAFPGIIALLVALLAGAALYAVAFAGIYSRPHTAVAASEWINANVTPGSSIVNGGSFWDERIPDLGRYNVWTFPAYHPDSDPAKIPELAQRLSAADYLIFYSNRAFGSIARLPDRYPQSAAFYQRLFARRPGLSIGAGVCVFPQDRGSIAVG